MGYCRIFAKILQISESRWQIIYPVVYIQILTKRIKLQWYNSISSFIFPGRLRRSVNISRDVRIVCDRWDRHVFKTPVDASKSRCRSNCLPLPSHGVSLGLRQMKQWLKNKYNKLVFEDCKFGQIIQFYDAIPTSVFLAADRCVEVFLMF